MDLRDFLELEIPDATSFLIGLESDLKQEWREAYRKKHQFDLLNPQPHHARETEAEETVIPMLTIATVPGREIARSLGIVLASCVSGTHLFKDVGAELVNIFGGRAEGYERTMNEAGDAALAAVMRKAVSLGADAVVGIRIDFGTTGATGGVLMASATGTAVLLRAVIESDRLNPGIDQRDPDGRKPNS